MAKTKNTERQKKPTNKNGKITKRGYQNPLTFKCRYEGCKKAFSNSGNRINHENQHKGESYYCPDCPYVGTTKKYLSRHQRHVHTEPTKYKCNVCGKAFHHSTALKEHVMVHTGEKPYKCDICDKSFRVSYSLKCHLVVHSGTRPYQCKFCVYACRDSSTLRRHEQRHLGTLKYFNCNMCPKKYESKQKLKYHISDAHLQHLNLDVRLHCCPHCDKKFKLKSNLNIHMELVHGPPQKCVCPVCDRVLSHARYLRTHMRTHFSERPFRCTYGKCAATFKDKGALKKHTIIHYPRLHYPCSICNRSFARRHRRDRHMRVHDERIKNVQCDYCGVKFYSKNYLIKHIKQKHAKKRKKYICDECGFKARNKPGLVVHLRYGHRDDNDLTCKLCAEKKEFKKFEYLKAHYLHTHNVRYKSHPDKVGKQNRKKTPTVEVKIEPIDEEPTEEIQLLEIDKVENDETKEEDYLAYSKLVLSEDLAEYILDDTTPETQFDSFLRKHVFYDRITVDDEPHPLQVDEVKLTEVTRKINNLIQKSLDEERQRIAEEKRREEDRLRRDRRRQEMRELMRIREFYNRRMKEAAERSSKEPPKKITYFKNNVPECNPKKEENIVRHKDKLIITSEDFIKETNDQEPNDETIDEKPVVDEMSMKIEELVGENAEANDKIIEKTEDGFNVLPEMNCDKSRDEILEHNVILKENAENVLNTNNDNTPNDTKILLDEVNFQDGKESIDSIQNDKSNEDNINKDNSDEDNIQNDQINDNNSQNDKVDGNNSQNDKVDGNNSQNDKLNENFTQNDKSAEDNSENDNLKHSCTQIDKLTAKDKEKRTNKNDDLKEASQNENVNEEDKTDGDENDKTANDKNDRDYIPRCAKVKNKSSTGKISFNSEQCYFCFKLYPTKQELNEHLKTHTNTETVKYINHAASRQIDKRNRERRDKTVAAAKLVKKGKEWIVESQPLRIQYEELPEFTTKELKRVLVQDNYVHRLGQLGRLARKRGVTMMFPCDQCEKICQNFSALKLHSRRHDPNKKPFAPRKKRDHVDSKRTLVNTVNYKHRTAKPKPIVNKHKCEEELKQFYENHIRGADIEFWQFLKIYNKMTRENINSFKDFEGRTDFGIHNKDEVNCDDLSPIVLMSEPQDPSPEEETVLRARGKIPAKRGGVRGKRGNIDGKRGRVRGQKGAIQGETGAIQGETGAIQGQPAAIPGQSGHDSGQNCIAKNSVGVPIEKSGVLPKLKKSAQRSNLDGKVKKPFARRILMSQKFRLEREAAIMRMRERIANNKN